MYVHIFDSAFLVVKDSRLYDNLLARVDSGSIAGLNGADPRAVWYSQLNWAKNLFIRLLAIFVMALFSPFLRYRYLSFILKHGRRAREPPGI